MNSHDDGPFLNHSTTNGVSLMTLVNNCSFVQSQVVIYCEKH